LLPEVVLDRTPVGLEHPPYLIAELGNNHGGRLETARKMILAAAVAGADAVKLQRRDNRALYTAEMYNQPYESPNALAETYGAHREALELPDRYWHILQDMAKACYVSFFATPFCSNSAKFLESLFVPMFKVASGDLKNTPFIRELAGYGKPLLISTGGGTLDDVERAVEAARGVPIVLLQCTASYPCKDEDMNLRVLETYSKTFPEVVLGLSDHQDGVCLGPAAIALGARVFEKHFTLNHSAKGTDHAFSLEPEGLATYRRYLDKAFAALGSAEKLPLGCEAGPIRKMGKSLVAARRIEAGEAITRDMVAIKSPAGGLDPYHLDEVLSSIAARPYEPDERLTLAGLA